MFTLNCKGKLLIIEKPIVMGIINATPDSFYAGSRHATAEDAVRTAAAMLEQGATILDLGGQSTRPGSEQLGTAAEAARMLPVIKAVHSAFPEALLSVDTYHSEVAKAAVDNGASIINDISGGLFDPAMPAVAASLKVPYVCMHLKGDANTMHSAPHYENVALEVLDHLIARLAILKDAGLKDIIVDPGFGFSKTSAHNFQLMKRLEIFSMLQKPLLVGISRKSTVYKTLGVAPEASLNGTTVLHTAALLKGATILRVHDVKEAMEAITLTELIRGA